MKKAKMYFALVEVWQVSLKRTSREIRAMVIDVANLPRYIPAAAETADLQNKVYLCLRDNYGGFVFPTCSVRCRILAIEALTSNKAVKAAKLAKKRYEDITQQFRFRSDAHAVAMCLFHARKVDFAMAYCCSGYHFC